jgi:hypothetical protein
MKLLIVQLSVCSSSPEQMPIQGLSGLEFVLTFAAWKCDVSAVALLNV